MDLQSNKTKTLINSGFQKLINSMPNQKEKGRNGMEWNDQWTSV